MQRMVQIHARIAISPAERLFVPIKISAGIGREHVTIWQSSGDAVGWRQAGVVALAENKRVLQYPKLTLLVFQRYSKAGACPVRVKSRPARWTSEGPLSPRQRPRKSQIKCYGTLVSAFPSISGHSSQLNIGPLCANRRLIHRSKRYCCRPDRSGPELAAARQKANNTKMRGVRQLTDVPRIRH